MAGHQPVIVPGKTTAHATAPPGDGNQLPVRIIGIVHQTGRFIQPDTVQSSVTIPAGEVPSGAVRQRLKRVIIVPEKENVMTTRLGNACQHRFPLWRQSRVSPYFAVRPINRPAFILMVLQPAFFCRTVAALADGNKRKGNQIARRGAPDQTILIAGQCRFPEQAPSLSQYAITGIAATPAALPIDG
nr:hypothetical protein PB20LOC_04380 [Pectobacterium parmentieri]